MLRGETFPYCAIQYTSDYIFLILLVFFPHSMVLSILVSCMHTSYMQYHSLTVTYGWACIAVISNRAHWFHPKIGTIFIALPGGLSILCQLRVFPKFHGWIGYSMIVSLLRHGFNFRPYWDTLSKDEIRVGLTICKWGFRGGNSGSLDSLEIYFQWKHWSLVEVSQDVAAWIQFPYGYSSGGTAPNRDGSPHN